MSQVHLQKEQLEKVSALGKQRFPKLTLGRNLITWINWPCCPGILHETHPEFFEGKPQQADAFSCVWGNRNDAQQFNLAAVAAGPLAN